MLDGNDDGNSINRVEEVWTDVSNSLIGASLARLSSHVEGLQVVNPALRASEEIVVALEELKDSAFASIWAAVIPLQYPTLANNFCKVALGVHPIKIRCTVTVPVPPSPLDRYMPESFALVVLFTAMCLRPRMSIVKSRGLS